MLSFENDYCCGAHPSILERLAATNATQHPGYGSDDVCAAAAEKIRRACASPEAPSYAGVVSADTGHVNVHEAGAIEATGHKVLTLPHHDGKIDAAELRDYCTTFYADGNYEHMVFPGTIYISHPTEYGTLYTLDELEALREVCDRFGMKLFLDGARLGYGLTADGTDVTLQDIARLTDVFYIGGTKVGALFGEAVVFPKNDAPAHFLTTIKQHGALLAKGWLLGLQFDTLFRPIRSSSRWTTRRSPVCRSTSASGSWKRPTTRTR